MTRDTLKQHVDTYVHRHLVHIEATLVDAFTDLVDKGYRTRNHGGMGDPELDHMIDMRLLKTGNELKRVFALDAIIKDHTRIVVGLDFDDDIVRCSLVFKDRSDNQQLSEFHINRSHRFDL